MVQNYQKPYGVAPEPVQNQFNVNDMLTVVMETEEGKEAYKSWVDKRDLVLSVLARQVPEGNQAYLEFEQKIKNIYNNVLLEAVKNNKKPDESAKYEKTIKDMQAKIDKLEAKPNGTK